jgi:hypothetical protein
MVALLASTAGLPVELAGRECARRSEARRGRACGSILWSNSKGTTAAVLCTLFVLGDMDGLIRTLLPRHIPGSMRVLRYDVIWETGNDLTAATARNEDK